MKLTLFLTSPRMMLPSSVQGFILFALCVLLHSNTTKMVPFGLVTVAGYLSEVSINHAIS